jgi:hypothetical protein
LEVLEQAGARADGVGEEGGAGLESGGVGDVVIWGDLRGGGGMLVEGR